jgi:hypothetical protein
MPVAAPQLLSAPAETLQPSWVVFAVPVEMLVLPGNFRETAESLALDFEKFLSQQQALDLSFVELVE